MPPLWLNWAIWWGIWAMLISALLYNSRKYRRKMIADLKDDIESQTKIIEKIRVENMSLRDSLAAPRYSVSSSVIVLGDGSRVVPLERVDPFDGSKTLLIPGDRDQFEDGTVVVLYPAPTLEVGEDGP